MSLIANGLKGIPLAILGAGGPSSTSLPAITLSKARAARPEDDPTAQVKIVGCQGSIEFHMGNVIEIASGSPSYPLEIEWMLAAGPNDCQLEVVARASTFIRSATDPQYDPDNYARSGVIFREGHLAASVFVLYGAIVGQDVVLTTGLVVCGGPAGDSIDGPITAVGNAIG